MGTCVCNLLNEIVIILDYTASGDWTKTKWFWKEAVVPNFRVPSKVFLRLRKTRTKHLWNTRQELRRLIQLTLYHILVSLLHLAE